MYNFKLPDIGEGLSEAELLEWTVRVGDRVREGDEVALISTDKVNVDLASPATGIVMELLGEPGDIIPVGTLIMRIDDDKRTGSGTKKSAVVESPPATADTSGESKIAAPHTTVKAAPIVRRYAADQNVDIASVSGTGPGGQVLRGDIDVYVLATQDTPEEVAGTQGRKLSGPRLAAAQHLAHAHRIQVATTIAFEVRADALLESLQRLSSGSEAKSASLTPTAMVLKCLVKALGKQPHFNATIHEDENELLLHEKINIGLAVDTSEGLIVPVIHDVETMSEFDIADEIERLAGLARSGGLKPEDVKDSTFTLSSTGGLEQATITATTPIINYPNVATLWVSRITDRPRVIDGELGLGPIMACSLSFDHRYLHGADAVAFINELERELLKNSAVSD